MTGQRPFNACEGRALDAQMEINSTGSFRRENSPTFRTKILRGIEFKEGGFSVLPAED